MNNLRQTLVNLIAKASSAGGSGGMQPPKGAGGLVFGLASLGMVSYGIYNSIVVIQPGHLGVKYNRIGGLADVATLSEGLNFIIPWLQRPVIYNIRTRPQLINSQSGSKDLQMVNIALRVLFKPDVHQLPQIYRKLGMDFDERVLPSVVNEVSKAVVAQYNAAELLTKRDQVSNQIRMLLAKRLSEFNILLDDVSITHLTFSKEYTSAVEAKQVAQQDAERSKYVVEKAIQEKKTIIIKAEGEAKSAQLIGAAINNNPAFVQLRRIEAAKEIALTISSSTNKVYINADTLLLNNLGDAKESSSKKSSYSF